MTYKVVYASSLMPGVEITMELPENFVYPINFVAEYTPDNNRPVRFWAERASVATPTQETEESPDS